VRQPFYAVNVYALGLFISKDGLQSELGEFKGKSKEQLDQAFFDKLIDSKVPKSFMLVMARDITGKQVNNKQIKPL
jgi:hypothetical protein